ncbi:phenoloxidase-activating factor 2-like [Choristoneura fumiferana]|uniref:phenoloxidase-activating factor 2-like n=1 Tax=Choristoneura fumiferana TaxID=7141 RepID=UPI003D156ABB
MCLHALQAAKPKRRVMLHSTQFCAGGDAGEDTCIGDGGSPLVCRIQGNATQAQWAVFGLAAWGAGCGVDGVPAVYVDVAKFYSWITSKLSPRMPESRSQVYCDVVIPTCSGKMCQNAAPISELKKTTVTSLRTTLKIQQYLELGHVHSTGTGSENLISRLWNMTGTGIPGSPGSL